ncbi:MAG: hypothetical protein MJ104_05070 [Lachnospiraceae bacterium]|nr:hypothetical protein [Lachnospiraceae bacterium]
MDWITLPEGEWYIFRCESELELANVLADVNDIGEDTDEILDEPIGVIYVGQDIPKKSWIRGRKSYCGWNVVKVDLNTMPDASQNGEIVLKKVVDGKVVEDSSDDWGY